MTADKQTSTPSAKEIRPAYHVQRYCYIRGRVKIDPEALPRAVFLNTVLETLLSDMA